MLAAASAPALRYTRAPRAPHTSRSAACTPVHAACVRPLPRLRLTVSTNIPIWCDIPSGLLPNPNLTLTSVLRMQIQGSMRAHPALFALCSVSASIVSLRAPSPSTPLSTPREMRRQLDHGKAFNTNIRGHLTGIIVIISPSDVIDVLAPWNVGVVQTQYGGSPYKFVEEIVRPLLCSPRVRPQPHCLYTCQHTRACMHVHTHTGDRCEQGAVQMVLGRTQHHLEHHWTH